MYLSVYRFWWSIVNLNLPKMASNIKNIRHINIIIQKVNIITTLSVHIKTSLSQDGVTNK